MPSMTDAEKAPMFDDVEPARRVRGDVIDVYTSAGAQAGRRPAVVFVHGGPVTPDSDPRDWPGYVGYASLAAASGLVGVVVRHRLYDEAHFPRAAEDVAAGVEQTRALDVVDPDRIALWCLSAGGPLAADWMRTPPPWLRCVVWTYPVLATPPGADGDVRFDALAALPASPDLPKLLVRVENEIAMFVPHQSAFVDAARAQGAALDVIDIPGVDHGFEGGDDVPEHARAAVHQAMDWTARTLRAGAPTAT
jgi:acetyl esterase/lipase